MYAKLFTTVYVEIFAEIFILRNCENAGSVRFSWCLFLQMLAKIKPLQKFNRDLVKCSSWMSATQECLLLGSTEISFLCVQIGWSTFSGKRRVY